MKTINIVITFCVLINIIFNIWLLYSDDLDGEWKMIAYDDVKKYIDSPENYSNVVSADEDLYRISTTSLTNINGRPENVAMINDYYGVTWWFSIINRYPQLYVDTLLQKK